MSSTGLILPTARQVPWSNNPNERGGQMRGYQENVSAGQYQPSPYQAWFGPPTNIPQQGPERDIWRTHQQGPAAWEGKNVFVGNFILGLVIVTNDELTQIIPKRFTEEKHFKWNVTKYDLALVPEVPPEGVVRVQQYSFESGSATTVRRGLGIKLEWDFFQTEMGQTTYIHQTTQLINSMIRTYELDIMNKLRNAPIEAGNWEKRYGYANVNVNIILNKFVENFAMLAKQLDGQGLYKAIRFFTDISGNNGVELTDILGGMNVRRWIDVNHKKTIEYQYRGNGGQEQVANAGRPKRTMGDWAYHEIKEFTDVKNRTSLGPMETYTMIGEYNTAFAMDRPKDCIESKDYIDAVTIRVFDEDKNSDKVELMADTLFDNVRWELIYDPSVGGTDLKPRKARLAWLFCYPECLDVEGNKKARLDLVYDNVFMAAARAGALPGATEHQQVCYAMQLERPGITGKQRVQQIKSLRKADPLDPAYDLYSKLIRNISFIIFKPFMRYLMNGMCGVKRGRETGELVIGRIDYGISVNNNDKTMFCNCTYSSACVLYAPQNVFWLDNVLYKQCLGGANTKFFTMSELSTLREANYRFNVLPVNHSLHTKSMIVCPLPKQANSSQIEKVIDITGKFLDDRSYSEPEHFMGAEWMRALLGTAVMRRTPPRLTFQKQFPNTNTICYQAKQVSQSKLGIFDKVITNAGHHGPYVYSTCANIRNNQDFEYEHVQAIRTVDY